MEISKTEFKAHALQILREIESSGKSIIITDRGKRTLEIKKLRERDLDPLNLLQGSVIKYEAATCPVANEDWELA